MLPTQPPPNHRIERREPAAQTRHTVHRTTKQKEPTMADWFETHLLEPRPSVATLANAMDVGDP